MGKTIQEKLKLIKIEREEEKKSAGGWGDYKLILLEREGASTISQGSL